jgi:hypothetical protein
MKTVADQFANMAIGARGCPDLRHGPGRTRTMASDPVPKGGCRRPSGEFAQRFDSLSGSGTTFVPDVPHDSPGFPYVGNGPLRQYDPAQPCPGQVRNGSACVGV